MLRSFFYSGERMGTKCRPAFSGVPPNHRKERGPLRFRSLVLNPMLKDINVTRRIRILKDIEDNQIDHIGTMGVQPLVDRGQRDLRCHLEGEAIFSR